MRESALLLAAHLSRVSGAEWTLTSGDSKLFRLLVHLTAVVSMYTCKGMWYIPPL